LASICAKVYAPDKGRVEVNGRAQLVALGVGFQIQLSGRENIYISGSLLGIKASEIRRKMDEIEKFADIGKFMDEQVRTYSTGMRSRLGFAIATAIRPDVLIMDEVMATGDRAFRDKAMDRIRKLHSLAKCAVIISHNPNMLKNICHRALWLERGALVMQGEPNQVLGRYLEFCGNPEEWTKKNSQYFGGGRFSQGLRGGKINP